MNPSLLMLHAKESTRCEIFRISVICCPLVGLLEKKKKSVLFRNPLAVRISPAVRRGLVMGPIDMKCQPDICNTCSTEVYGKHPFFQIYICEEDYSRIWLGQSCDYQAQVVMFSSFYQWCIMQIDHRKKKNNKTAKYFFTHCKGSKVSKRVQILEK